MLEVVSLMLELLSIILLFLHLPTLMVKYMVSLKLLRDFKIKNGKCNPADTHSHDKTSFLVRNLNTKPYVMVVLISALQWIFHSMLRSSSKTPLSLFGFHLAT